MAHGEVASKEAALFMPTLDPLCLLDYNNAPLPLEKEETRGNPLRTLEASKVHLSDGLCCF